MTIAEAALKERVNKIKKVLCERIDAKKKNPNANTPELESHFNELLFGNEKNGIASINCLINNSIQSRPGKKSNIDLRRLNANNLHEFKVVDMFSDLINAIEEHDDRDKITINADSFLKGAIEAMKNSCSSYTEEMKNFYNIAAPANNISQAASVMPENSGIPAANDVPAVNPAPNEDKNKICCPIGIICTHLPAR